MKLVIIITFASFMQVSAAVFAQKITLKDRNISLESVFKSIRNQTGFDFVYDSRLIAPGKKISLNLKDMDLEDALTNILKDQNIIFVIKDKIVVLDRKELTFLDKVIAQFQYIDVSGKVLDDKGISLPGATILIKDSKRITKTNSNGEFFIPNVDKNAVLVISYIGYKSLEINLTTAVIPLEIKLNQATGDLEEVSVTINTGYQRVRPEQSTGSVSVITTKAYESRVSTNFLDGLVNKLPGLMINNDVKFSSNINGTSSSNSLFNVRGISTISGNQNPLIVIDGYPTELTLDMVDPNEIKSVTILKDAAAATVYGVRASNGVIVIERKQAVAGRTRFNFRATTGFTPKEDYSRYRWAPDGSAINIAYNQDLYKNSVVGTTWAALRRPTGTIYNPVFYLMSQQAANIVSPQQAGQQYQEMTNYNNAEDYGRLFLRSAINQTYNANISGGNPGALYYITANYTRGRSQLINNDNQRFVLSGRTTLNLSKRLSLELSTDYMEQLKTSAPIPDIQILNPYERLQDEEGAPLSITAGSGINPYYNAVIMARGFQDNLVYPLVDVNEINDKVKTINNRITANFKYTLNDAFNLTFGGIYESSKTDLRHYASERSSQARQYVNTYIQTNATGGLVYNIPQGGFLQQQTGNTTGYTVRAQLNYDKQINKDHSLNGIIGTEIRDVVDQLGTASYFGYNDQTLLQQPVNYGVISASTTNPVLTGTPIVYNNLFNQQYKDNRYISAFSNIVYSFRNTYSLTASARMDQSNLFGTDPRYKYKPLWSVGLGWNIHKENFMQNIPWVKQLKLRIADGINGNVAKNSLPRVIASAVTNLNTVPVSQALARFAFANSTLRWEQTNNFNAGLDFSIFRSITGSIDYYKKKSTDLLSTAQINPSIGTTAIINAASINNQGLELNLHADWITHAGFNWNTGFVLSRNTSKVLKVYQNLIYYPVTLNTAGYVEGYPLGGLFTYRWAGLDNTGVPQIQDDKGKVYSTTAPGVNSLMSTNGRTSGLVQYIGSSVPSVNAGLSNRVDIGNFYFYCMVNYYGGFKVLIPRPSPLDIRPLKGAGTYWKQPGDESNTDVMSLAAFSSAYPRYAYQYSDNYVVNGDYLTLADVTASYNFNNSKFLKKAGFSQFELKVQASNIYTVGLNKFNFSKAMGTYQKSYITPTYTLALFTSF